MDPILKLVIEVDHAIFHLINQVLSNPVFDWIMPLFDQPVYWVLPLLVFWIFLMVKDPENRLKLVILIPLIIILCDQTGGLIKDLGLRQRPWVALDPDLVNHLGSSGGKTKSFPSNHAANITGAAVIFSALYRQYRPVVWALAVTVMYSRIYIGVHFLIDVLAGALLGVVYGNLLLFLWDRTNKFRNRNVPDLH
ncbi:MAG: phosphatase PAP2 family protein [FCB group bacterium]|nr:phosphatase PAP2 family protein [FCB group bacterium]